MVQIPKVSQKVSDGNFGAVDLGFTILDDFALNNIEPVLKTSLYNSDGPLEAYYVDVVSGGIVVNFNNGFLGFPNFVPVYDGAGVFAAIQSVDPSTNTWDFGRAMIAGDLMVSNTRILAGFPLGVVNSEFMVSFPSALIASCSNLKSVESGGIFSLFIIEHDAVGSDIYNAVEYDDQTEYEASVIGTSTSFEFISLIPNAGGYDYCLLNCPIESATAHANLSCFNKEAYLTVFDADKFSVTLDDIDFDFANAQLIGADSLYFYLFCPDQNAIDCLIVMDANGDNYRALRFPNGELIQSAKGLDNDNLILIIDDGGGPALFSAIELTGAKPNAMAVKDAISLPCYNPCLHYAIKEEF